MAHKGGHHRPKTKQIKEERRKRAEAIQTESGYSELTTKDKLARVLELVLSGNGNAARQRAKLEAQLVKEQK